MFATLSNICSALPTFTFHHQFIWGPVVFVLAYLWVFYSLYVYSMGVYRAYLAKRLSVFQLIILSPMVLVAWVIDVIFNYTFAVLIFVEWPRRTEITLSMRLMRYHRQTFTDWRKSIATYVCVNLLDPFDPNGDHC